MNPFTFRANVDPKISRDAHDLSKTVNGSFNFGRLYPIHTREVIPGETYDNQPSFGFEFAPTPFPVQTRMTARFHTFYVRKRNLWKDFMDFQGNTKPNLVKPYIDAAANPNYGKVGGLFDYFGIPVVSYGTTLNINTDIGVSLVPIASNPENALNWPTDIDLSPAQFVSSLPVSSYTLGLTSGGTGNNMAKAFLSIPFADLNTVFGTLNLSFTQVLSFDSLPDFKTLESYQEYLQQTYSSVFSRVVVYTGGPSGSSVLYDSSSEPSFSAMSVKISLTSLENGKVSGTAYYTVSLSSDLISRIKLSVSPSSNVVLSFIVPPTTGPNIANPVGLQKDGLWVPTFILQSLTTPDGSIATPLSSIDPVLWPYYRSDRPDDENVIKLNAEPFRAYESIYNAFYRNSRNNPRIVDGVPEYNKYITTDEGGLDSTIYDLYPVSWERDFLTEAVQSPQQGAAPLVGIQQQIPTSVSYNDEQGNRVTIDLNAHTLDGEIKAVDVLATLDDSQREALAPFLQYATSGISINDFRNVNAFQKWLEKNMMSGYKFPDVVKAHYGVKIKYDELDVPLFIGGFTQTLRSNMVTQTTETSDSPLGSFAGQLSCAGQSPHRIRHFCDEPGYVITVLSFSAVPSYSQLLPPLFRKRTVLENFSPEFAHIGLVPITYEEVCPIEAKKQNIPLSTVFGYQRSWYEDVSDVDTVVGEMRTTLRPYLVNRVFAQPPVLNGSFLNMDASQINDIFAVRDPSEDKIFGQIYFDLKSISPVPKDGTPRLD